MGARGKLEDRDHDAEGPLRRCAVSRAQKPAEELIRFAERKGFDRVGALLQVQVDMAEDI